MLQSPGIEIKEKDKTLIVPSVSSTVGGIAGRFTNGPISVPYLVSSEADLVSVFGAPADTNFPEWFTAAEFLKYSGAMYVVRAAAIDTASATHKAGTPIVFKSQNDFEDKLSEDDNLTNGTYGLWASKMPGNIGNSVSVIAIDAGNWDEFATWSSTKKSVYNVDLTTLFSQPPKTSQWLQNKLINGKGATFAVSTTNGSVSSVNIVKGGSGYTQGAYIEFNGAGSGASVTPVVTNGVISKIELVTKGTGYSSAPTISISAPVGGGVTATATCTIGSSGADLNKVVTITITNGGSGYSANESIVITFTGSGTGASATVPTDGISDGVITSVTNLVGGINYGTGGVTATAFNMSVNDEVHFLVLDATGEISGVANSVLEVYEGLSKVSDAMNAFGGDNYYMSVVNNNSKYVYWIKAPAIGATTFDVLNTAGKHEWGIKSTTIVSDIKGFRVFSALVSPAKLTGGNDGSTVTDGQIKDAYSLLANVDQYDISCLPCAAYSPDIIKHIVETVAYSRKDAIAFISPYSVSDSDLSTNKYILLKTPTAIINFKNIDLAISDMYAQYAVMDTGWKYLFDKYNNKYRWVPLNGDIAGVVARLELVAEPWFSPGGYDRGGIKNVIKLSYNPVQADRDAMYPKGINPVVVLPSGGGVMLYGDRTMTSKPSAFDRVNVRRLFNILEKSIGTMAKYKLFEINDNFTRSDFKSKVDSYLRDIQGRRGITEYLVVCDGTNNTGVVIDANEFRADIYVRPSRSINFISLSFIATPTGVAFSTVVGS